MAMIKLSIILAILFCLSSGKAFIPYARLIMTSKYLSGDSLAITDSLGGALQLTDYSGGTIPATCGSTPASTNGYITDFQILSTTSEVAISVWYYETTIGDGQSTYPFAFARDAGNAAHDYSVRADTTDIWTAYFEDANILDGNGNPSRTNSDDMTITEVFNKWSFITFHWVDNAGTVTWSIYTQEDKLSNTAASPAYVIPTYLTLGISWDGLFYEVIFHKGVSITGSGAPYAINLLDDKGGSFVAMATTICSSDCAGKCHPKMGCLSTTDCQCPVLCSSCDGSGVCQGCSDDYRAGTDCQCFVNCPKCNSSSECDHCDANYFLNTDSESNLRCFSCTTSCSDCNSGECFICADLVVQDSGTCREDSVGFQISFSHPNIVIEFAAPLKSTLTKDSLSAKYQGGLGSAIDITNWSIDAANSDSTKLIVVTDNILESDLPISVDFSFNGGS